MNVACTACPAKYAVPDERVRGKRARITCKHCGTSIIVDGTSLGPSDGGSVVAARPARKTMLGMGQVGASAPVAASAPLHSAPLHSAPSNAPLSGGTAWLVALADGRREPASQARIVDLYAAGTIDASTYIWREGMPEWKTPFSIPEVSAALTARGLKPRQPSLVPAGEQDPEEATRVAISVLDDPSLARLRAPARAATGAHWSQPPPEDDDGITIARSGPPSSPLSRPPARAPSEPSRAAPRPQPPSAVRSAPPSPVPPPRTPSDASPNPRGRPRAHTLPGDLVIPLTGPAAPPPTPLFAPRGQPFARRATSSSPPGPSGLVAPSAMVAPSAPIASSAPPPPPAWGPPATPILPEAELMVAPSAVNLPAPARGSLDFEVPPRSAAPVAVPLEFTQGPQRRRRALATVVTLGVLAVSGLGFTAYWKSRPKQPRPAAAAPTPSAVVMAATPSAAPPASAEPETPAPEPSAEVTKPSTRDRAAAPAAARAAAASRREEAALRAASPRKAEVAKAETAEPDSTPAAASNSEGEAPARTEEAPKKAETGPSGSAPFDRDSAAEALSDAALRAGTCRMLGGPTGSAQATVTFAPSGHVSAASVGGDFAGSVVGACVVKLFRSAIVPAFAGDPVTVAKRFNIE